MKKLAMKPLKYLDDFNEYIHSKEFILNYRKSLNIIKKSQRIFFIGNGGSNAICSHMAEDFQKVLKFPTFCFSDGALITCYANDYGYENAMFEWIKGHAQKGDLLIAISSSGESTNILNTAKFFKTYIGDIITLSGFEKTNTLSTMGSINFSTETKSYGITECLHELILHSLLDQINENQK